MKLLVNALGKYLSGLVLLGVLLFLPAELPGYEEYKRKVRYRLIPFLW